MQERDACCVRGYIAEEEATPARAESTGRPRPSENLAPAPPAFFQNGGGPGARLDSFSDQSGSLPEDSLTALDASSAQVASTSTAANERARLTSRFSATPDNRGENVTDEKNKTEGDSDNEHGAVSCTTQRALWWPVPVDSVPPFYAKWLHMQHMTAASSDGDSPKLNTWVGAPADDAQAGTLWEVDNDEPEGKRANRKNAPVSRPSVSSHCSGARAMCASGSDISKDNLLSFDTSGALAAHVVTAQSMTSCTKSLELGPPAVLTSSSSGMLTVSTVVDGSIVSPCDTSGKDALTSGNASKFTSKSKASNNAASRRLHKRARHDVIPANPAG